jgi:hypothetical protein
VLRAARLRAAISSTSRRALAWSTKAL